MAGHLTVSADEVFATSHSVGNDAEELREELARIVQEWDNVSHGWSGAAASAYTALWHEWHEGATTLINVLADSSHRLGHAAVAYHDHEVRQDRQGCRKHLEDLREHRHGRQGGSRHRRRAQEARAHQEPR